MTKTTKRRVFKPTGSSPNWQDIDASQSPTSHGTNKGLAKEQSLESISVTRSLKAPFEHLLTIIVKSMRVCASMGRARVSFAAEISGQQFAATANV